MEERFVLINEKEHGVGSSGVADVQEMVADAAEIRVFSVDDVVFRLPQWGRICRAERHRSLVTI